MINNFNEDYQYDGCISRGICSLNPRTSSLQEVLILYLKHAAYYALELYQNNIDNESIRKTILNTISVIVSNPEFTETDFNIATAKFNAELPKLIKQYSDFCKENHYEPKYLKTTLNFEKKTDIIKSIQAGEREFLKKVKALPDTIRDLYKILFVLAKSICINTLDLESYDISDPKGYLMILKLLNTLNDELHDINVLKNIIKEAANINNVLMKLIRDTQVQMYGIQTETEVSYSTVPAKAILVVGSNIKELQDILEAVKDKNIDVYTHDEMMLAHTFPFFKKYKNLKGQYGHGIENCLLDFATFPGPIILTKHSLYNVEHLYRGRLFTTDFAYSKGVIPIKNKDFSAVIASAENAKGFKTGKQCESVSIGFDYDKSLNDIKSKLANKNYSGIFVISTCGFTLEEQSYFSKLLKQTPSNILIVSFSFCTEKINIMCLNACFDSFAPAYFAEQISEFTNIPITVFFPKCHLHTMSRMIYLSQKNNLRIFVGKCTPIILNPNLITTLNKEFNIQGLSTIKKDLENILK